MIEATDRPERETAPVPANVGELRPAAVRRPDLGDLPDAELERLIFSLEEEMRDAAAELRFEYATRLRDEVKGPAPRTARDGLALCPLRASHVSHRRRCR